MYNRVLLLAFCLAGSPVYAQRISPVNKGVEVARSKVYPALVNITVVMRYYSGGRAQRAPGGGSGVIVSPSGHVITNYHVAGNTTRIVCTMPNGDSMEAKVVAHDIPTDISVLKLRLRNRARPLPYAHLGNSDALQVGETVISMGNPLMLSSSLTVGVVSNPRRVFTDFLANQMEEQELDEGEKTGMFTRWIQHDALIQPGNSGGPLVNTRGEVVGINELGGSGMGFAIPSNTVARVLRQAIAIGKIRRGWLGISLVPAEKLSRSNGALVDYVSPKSPAEKAGITAGDLLLSVAGKPTNARFFEQIPPVYQLVADLPVGSSTTLTYQRGGHVYAAHAVVGEMPSEVGEYAEVRKLGITVRGITQSMALARHLPAAGVLVTGVRAGFPFESATPKVADGDVITSLGGKATPNVHAFSVAASSLNGADAVVAFRRRDESLLTTVKLNSPPDQEEGGELPKAWLGVKTQVVTPEVAKALSKSALKGFRVTDVLPWTKAKAADIRVGDVIVALNDAELEAYRAQDSEDLKHAIEELTVGEKAKLEIWRGGAKREVSVALEPTPDSADKAKKAVNEEFEFSVRNITRLDRMEKRWRENDQGVLVVETTPGGWAQMAGLHADDAIFSIAGHRITDVDSFQRVMRQVMKQRPKVVDLQVRREYRSHFVFIEPDWANLGHVK